MKESTFQKKEGTHGKDLIVVFYSYVTFSFLPLGVCHQPN